MNGMDAKKTFKILFGGDIVGAPGRAAAARTATRFKQSGKADFVVLNAENAAAGRGINAKLAAELFAAGADVLTMGDHVWDQRDSYPLFDREPRIVRALNLPPGCPGRGAATVETPVGPITVVQLLGRTFMSFPADCPFRAMDAWLAQPRRPGAVFVDFHAEATSEKIALRHFLDGRVAGIFGTHTHVPTADECVTAKGTAYITDLGMTGAHDSVIGRTVGPIVDRFRTGMPAKFEVATGDVRFNGVLVTLDAATRRALRIQRICEKEE